MQKNAPASAGTYRLVRKLPFYSYLHRILHRATIELDTDHVDALGESPDFAGQVRRSCRNISCKARHLVASHVKEIHLGIPRFAGNQRTICKIQVYSGSNANVTCKVVFCGVIATGKSRRSRRVSRDFSAQGVYRRELRRILEKHHAFDIKTDLVDIRVLADFL